MSGKVSADTLKALRAVASGRMTAYAAAKRYGLALSTIYRALKREREASAPAPRAKSKKA